MTDAYIVQMQLEDLRRAHKQLKDEYATLHRRFGALSLFVEDLKHIIHSGPDTGVDSGSGHEEVRRFVWDRKDRFTKYGEGL